ncbi:GNAT family N-acetyltransferase [Arenimonas sp.]|uniref:GNAT family N-acetyltransferase n=1 Tax=Arenimonas sp. TaxID=1872635 RepID=UPI0039E5E1B0
MTSPRSRASDPYRHENLRLADGRELCLRPIDPADAAPIDAAFALLHEDEVRRRFLHPVKALSPDHLLRLTHPPTHEAYAVVAAEALPPGEALVGAVARAARETPGSDRAEFGLLVSHYIAGQGLGRRLLSRLIEWSHREGLRTLWGDTIEDNLPMLHVADALGFRREALREASGLIRISLNLTQAARTSRRRPRM